MGSCEDSQASEDEGNAMRIVSCDWIKYVICSQRGVLMVSRLQVLDARKRGSHSVVCVCVCVCAVVR